MTVGWWGEKKLRTVWKLEWEERSSFLVGSAHFSPYQFKRGLTNLIRGVEDVFFEGPLDETSMAKVVEYGRRDEGVPSLYDALEPAVLREINKRLGDRSLPERSTETYFELFGSKRHDFVEIHVRGVRPWMALFTLWATFLNFKYSIDLEAFRIAQELGRRIHYLETIEEQLAALDGIPFEGIVDYVNRFEHWKSYKKLFVDFFLAGDLEKLMSRTTRFPTRCESILGDRDRRLFERMKPAFDKGGAIAFLGLSHIPTMKNMFSDVGYQVNQIAS